MYTALTLVALTMGTLSPSPAFMNDYKAAQAKVTVAGKPMAVFVGNGKAGWESVVREGFDPAVTKLLSEKFVCLYVDSSTPAGKILASDFQVGEKGVVLSDKSGKTQSYNATGTVSRTELTRALVAYADLDEAQKTDAPKSAAPAAAPAAAAPMMATPAYMTAGNCNTCTTGTCYKGGCNTGCASPCNTGCTTSKGCCFFSKCGGSSCGYSQPTCGTTKSCGFFSKCGGGYSSGCGTKCGYSNGCGGMSYSGGCGTTSCATCK